MFDGISNNVLKELSVEQQAACTALNNIVLTACPGSGKTRTLTHRLAYQVIQEPDSKKKKIAITYTNRAAEEIINRLDRYYSSILHAFYYSSLFYVFKEIV